MSMFLGDRGLGGGVAIRGGDLEITDRRFTDVIVGPSSTAETTIYSKTILGDEPQAGDMYELVLVGDINQAVGSNANLTTRIKFGSTTVIDSGLQVVSTGVASGNRRKFVMRVYLFVESATAQRFSVDCLVSNSAASSGVALTGSQPSWVGYGVGVEDTSTAKDLVVTAQWGTSAASIDLRCHGGFLSRYADFP